jgi:hypothetical protein
MSNRPTIALSLDAVIVAVTGDEPRVLALGAPGATDALPSGLLDADRHQTLERGLREWVERQTGLKLGYVEQLYTFGDRFRDGHEATGTARVVSAAYLALVREEALAAHPAARFRGVYQFLPWEDWRSGRPASIERELRPLLATWAGADKRRRERIDLSFGLQGAPWDPERTLERYELLWEAGLVGEALRAPAKQATAATPSGLGQAMALDHRRILATALGRLRGKLRYRPVVFELLPPEFTLLQLQRVVEALAGTRLHKPNFRRLVESAGLVERTGRMEHTARGRPAELFRFRHEVFRERPAPGVYFPGAWWSR